MKPAWSHLATVQGRKLCGMGGGRRQGGSSLETLSGSLASGIGSVGHKHCRVSTIERPTGAAGFTGYATAADPLLSERSRSVLKASWSRPGDILDTSWVLLAVSFGLRLSSGGFWVRPRGVVGASRGCPGDVLGTSSRSTGVLVASWGRIGGVFGASWGVPGASWVCAEGVSEASWGSKRLLTCERPVGQPEKRRNL